jgi:glutamate synthase (NADPH/NADH) large chain
MGFPPVQGLYDPRNEHDACGMGLSPYQRRSHAIIGQALEILRNLDHRGAVGADPLLGDGAGILIQLPDQLPQWAASQGKELPQPGDMPWPCASCRRMSRANFVTASSRSSSPRKELIGWRDVPVTLDGLGKTVIESMPVIRQSSSAARTAPIRTFERKLLAIRKQTQNPLAAMAEKHGCRA